MAEISFVGFPEYWVTEDWETEYWVMEDWGMEHWGTVIEAAEYWGMEDWTTIIETISGTKRIAKYYNINEKTLITLP